MNLCGIVWMLLSAVLTAVCGLMCPFLGTFPGCLVLLPVWALGVLLLAILHYAVLWCITLFVDQKKPPEHRSAFYRRILNQVVDMVLRLSRVHIHTRGMAKLVGLPPYLLVANHVSAYDPFVGLQLLRDQDLSYISKPENFRIPFVGAVLHKCFFLPIDRDNDRKALETILRAAKLIREGTVSMGIYPEGTRSRTGELLPFRNGAFQIAKRAKCPIVVARTTGTQQISANLLRRRTDVVFELLEVISAEEAAAMTTAEIGDRVRRAMEG